MLKTQNPSIHELFVSFVIDGFCGSKGVKCLVGQEGFLKTVLATSFDKIQESVCQIVLFI